MKPVMPNLMRPAVQWQADQLASSLAQGCSARDVAEVFTKLHVALTDRVDKRITDMIYDAAYQLDQLHDEMDDETCTCPMEMVTPTMIDPPERILNRDCPVHGREPDPDKEREARRESQWDR